MRNRLLLLTAAVLLSACADDQHATAPANSRSARSGEVRDLGLSRQATVNAAAKPIDQVGFTKITSVSSGLVNMDAGQITTTTATCPAGSTAVSGSYDITLFVATASFPWIKINGLNGQNGWTVNIWNQQVGASSFTYFVTAYCAS